jgi:hypothetical protein
MSRIRTLKPTRFTSRSLAKCPRDARTTFEGMWCEADDHGRGIADARLLKGAIWPLDDDITFLHVSAFIDVLAATGHIRLYAVDGETYYEVTNWEKHQAAAYRRGDAKYPPFSAGQPLESLSAHENVQESAAGTQASAGTGNREQGTGITPDTSSAPPPPSQEPLIDVPEETSTEVAVVDNVIEIRRDDAGAILGELIDRCTDRGVTLAGRVKGHFAREIKTALEEKTAPDIIRAALASMVADNVLDKPSWLPNRIVKAQTGAEVYRRGQSTSVTDERAAGWIMLGAQMGAAS